MGFAYLIPCSLTRDAVAALDEFILNVSLFQYFEFRFGFVEALWKDNWIMLKSDRDMTESESFGMPWSPVLDKKNDYKREQRLEMRLLYTLWQVHTPDIFPSPSYIVLVHFYNWILIRRLVQPVVSRCCLRTSFSFDSQRINAVNFWTTHNR